MMSKWSKRAAAVAALGLLLTQIVWPGAKKADAALFSDTGSHWGKASVEWAVQQGIVDGYEDGTFRPDRSVSEPEFLSMLIRAFPEAGKAESPRKGGQWYDGYYSLAEARYWPVLGSKNKVEYNRGHVARLVAGTQGRILAESQAVQFLLDQGLSQGKTSATIAGYASRDPLTRAEAVQFLRNAKQAGLTVQAAVPTDDTKTTDGPSVRGIALGDAESSVIAKLGQPDRKDWSKYGFEWYVYNSDLTKYTLAGIRGGQVVGVYTAGGDWSPGKNAVAPATKSEAASSVLGSRLDSLTKGDTRYILQNNGDMEMFQSGDAYVTLYYDTQNGNKVSGALLLNAEEEDRLPSLYGEAGERLRESYERELFDLANVFRVQNGLKPYTWNDKVASVSRSHSKDMADQGYFDHTGLDGKQPWDRAVASGLRYSGYGENIAAGQTDAFEAHQAWVNSKSGHRENLLGAERELGVGVAFGGSMDVYYTQNFYTGR